MNAPTFPEAESAVLARVERSDAAFRAAGRRLTLPQMELRNRRADEKRGEPATCRAIVATLLEGAGRTRRYYGTSGAASVRYTLRCVRYYRAGPVLP